MKVFQFFFILSIETLLGILIVGCSNSSNNPSSTVQSYLKAIIDRDEPALVNLVCSAWEADARTEFNSFTAVKLTLDNVSCQESEKSDDTTLVTCQGAIVASYGAEDLVLELHDREFQVVQEAGEWRVCGYKAP